MDPKSANEEYQLQRMREFLEEQRQAKERAALIQYARTMQLVLNKRPLIQLSCLMKTDDQIWFTLFHELGHVLLHGEKELYVSGDQGAEEDEANAFAADVLVPPGHVSRLPRRRDTVAISRLASELGVAPSIVLGRAQRQTGDFAWGHALKRRVDWTGVDSGTSINPTNSSESSLCPR